MLYTVLAKAVDDIVYGRPSCAFAIIAAKELVKTVTSMVNIRKCVINKNIVNKIFPVSYTAVNTFL